MKLKAVLAWFVILYAIERGDPFLTVPWPRWKKRIIFNPLMDKFFDLACIILRRR